MLSNEKENKIKVAFQGEKGAFSDEAALKFFSKNIETFGFEILSNLENCF
jgi:prephenate dehydratase